MYREPPRRGELELPPSEMVYPAVEQPTHAASAKNLIKLVVLPGSVGSVLSVLATPAYGAFGFAATVAFLLWNGWRAKSASWLIVRVEGADVDLVGHDDKRSKGRFRLADLDVTLDTKTIRRVEEGQSAIPAVRFLDSRVGPELDIARIVFVSGDGESVPLTDAYVAHMDAIEWFGKIRVFLRKHGWLPEDERNVEGAS